MDKRFGFLLDIETLLHGEVTLLKSTCSHLVGAWVGGGDYNIDVDVKNCILKFQIA